MATCNEGEPPTIKLTPSIKASNPSQMDINQHLIVTVSVMDVIDLYAWQIKLAFNISVLTCVNASLGSDHVFAGKNFFPFLPEINNYEGWVFSMCTLLGDELGFTGSGTLCQIEFKTYALGDSYINFVEDETILMNSTLANITCFLENSNVTVISEFSVFILSSFFLIATAILVFLAKKFSTMKKVSTNCN